MSGRAPLFWQTPIRYWRWSMRERPALFWSCIIGALGPVTLVAVPPIRHALGDPDAKPIPTTYPSTAHPKDAHGVSCADIVNSPSRPQEDAEWLRRRLRVANTPGRVEA